MQTDKLWNHFASIIFHENIFLYLEPAALLGGLFISPLLTTTAATRSLDLSQLGAGQRRKRQGQGKDG